MSPNTLSASSSQYLISAQLSKNMVAVWRWDKKEPVLKFSVKEPISCMKVSPGGGGGVQIAVVGYSSGKIGVWDLQSGQLLGEVEQAHYMDVSSLDLTPKSDMVVSGGKDGKVRIWMTS